MRLTLLVALFLGTAAACLPQSDSVLLLKNYNGMKYPDFVKAAGVDLGIRFMANSPKADSLVIRQGKTPESLGDVLRASFEGTRFSYYAYNQSLIVVLDDYVIFDNIPGYFTRSAAAVTKVDAPKNIEFLSESKNLQKKKTQNYTFGIPTDKTDKRRAVLSGHIVEASTGEVVAGATIVVEGLNTGVMADANGYFSIDLPQGRHTIVIRSMGSEEKKLGVNLFANGKINVELKEQTTSIDEVHIVANQVNKVQNVQMGIETMEMKTIKALPSALGEADIVKAATMLPGVQTVGECASGFNVRGGSVDQNLILLDGAPIFNSSHLFGFFSVFNQDVVDDFMLYKSGVPAKYGGRASSVLDVTTRTGDKDTYSAAAGVSPITGRIYVEGPATQRTTFLAAARSTYSDWLLKNIDDPRLSNSSASFWDGNLKIGHSLNKNNKIKLSLYRSGDKFRLDSDTSFKYENTCGSLLWSHTYNSTLTQENSLVFSNYAYAIESQSTPIEAFKLDYNIRYMSAETKFKYSALAKHKVAFGLKTDHYSLTPSAMHPVGKESLIESTPGVHDNAVDVSVFADDEWTLTDRLLVYGGLRANTFLSAGTRDVYQYLPGLPLSRTTLVDTVHYGSLGVSKVYVALEPRLSFRYKLGRVNSVKASYNRMTQNLHMLSNSAAVSPTDSWTLSGEHIRPQRANIFSIGYYHNLRDNMFELSVEMYFKRIRDVLDFKGGAQLLANPTVETDVLQGLQEAYGAELLIRKAVGNLTGWIGYTYSVSRIKMESPFVEEQVNGGKFYPSNYDKPHDIIFVMNYKLNRRLNFSTSITYNTGRPITYPVATYTFKGKTLLYYTDRNEYRVPDYFRCDASINIDANLKSKKISASYWSISVYNLTGRDNVYSVFFKANPRGGMKGYQMSIFPRPLPTISYNIKF